MPVELDLVVHIVTSSFNAIATVAPTLPTADDVAPQHFPICVHLGIVTLPLTRVKTSKEVEVKRGGKEDIHRGGKRRERVGKRGRLN